jgi:DNA-binding IscR family transcriptional regulator
MLEKLLTEIRSGGTFETGSLAARLGTTPELVEAMLAHLQRAGYIQPYRTCGDACGGCSLKSACKVPGQKEGVRLWQG